LLKGATERELNGESPATAWFAHDIAERYYVQEHSLQTNYGVVPTLPWWKNERMLITIEEYEERRANRRADRLWEDEY
jgi:hypothetical protein